MAQRQFRSDDTDRWLDGYGTGSAGALSQNTATDSTANTTLTGTSGGTAATVGSGSGFSNGDLVVIHQTQKTGAFTWELNKISSGGGTTSWTMGYNLINTYGSGAQVYRMIQYSTATINSGQTFTSAGWGGSVGGITVIMAAQSITIPGTLQNTGVGFRGGAMNGQNQPCQYGEGGPGPQATAGSTNNNGNGGGGNYPGGNLYVGSGGGNGTAGSQGNFSNTVGTTAGSADLTSAAFGGGGASGTWNINNVGGNAAGAAGGGFVLLISPVITITGAVTSGGNAGGSATDDNGLRGFAGGGGAGGSILLKGNIITLGTNLATASGGSGGTGSGSSESHNGGAGGSGRIHADYGTSITGSTTPTIDTRQDTGLVVGGGASMLFTLI